MGVHILDHDGGGGVRRNGRPTDWSQLSGFLDTLDDCVITPYVQQAAYAQAISPTPNTIRMLVMNDDDGPFVAAAVHRFGTASSGPVDNWSQGGMSAAVDLATGVLGRAASPREGGIVWLDDHPDSGSRISGTAVTGWSAVRDGILDLARRTSFLPYVGWDVMATDDGFQVIEGNKFSDVQVLQVHRPLLTHRRVRDFYRHQRINQG